MNTFIDNPFSDNDLDSSDGLFSDPLKDSSRDTGFRDYFWDTDLIETSEAEDLIGEGDE